MEFFQAKETHHVRTKREIHTVKVLIPAPLTKYVEKALETLRTKHNVPDDANIRVASGWTCWVVANWVIDR